MPYESDMGTLTMVCTQAETVWESGENWAGEGSKLVQYCLKTSVALLVIDKQLYP